LAVLFHESFDSNKVQFSNDAPLGVYAADWTQPPGCFTGAWSDLNSLGINAGIWPVSISTCLRWLIGPIGYSRFYVPFTLLFVGFSVWVLLRTMKFRPGVSAVAALSVATTSCYFSAACWGVGTQIVGIGLQCLALAAIISSANGRRWIKLAIAGFAVGAAVTEAIDNGALFSLFIAAFVLYQALIEDLQPFLKRIILGIARIAVVAVCAGIVAAPTISSLVATQIKGVAGMGEDEQTKLGRWDWATTWSLPKREVLTFFIPGIFGFRLDTPDGGNYWGAGGRDPSWDRYFAHNKTGPPPQGAIRHTGGGNYLGSAVVLISLWAALQAFRRDRSVFQLDQRRIIWFWVVTAVVSLLCAFGRFAPFYRLFYALPYFSTIRNPAKFIAIFDWSILILFAYGLQGLFRKYVTETPPSKLSFGVRLKNWREKSDLFERRWFAACIYALTASLIGWAVYASLRSSLEAYMRSVQIPDSMVAAMAGYSIRQVGWFVLFFAATFGMMLLIMTGTFSGQRAKWAAILMGLVVVLDLGRANLPWIKYWDFKEKYASNPIIDFFRKEPYKNRVAMLPFRFPQPFTTFLGPSGIYSIEWIQHHFQFYNVQSLDIIQMPRPPQDIAAFQGAMTTSGLVRLWQLTNTRYLLGAAVIPTEDQRVVPFLEVLNREVDPKYQRFQTITGFNVVPKPGVLNATQYEQVTVDLGSPTNSYYALYDFAGALPRVKLYTDWKVSTNDNPAALEQWVKTARERSPAEYANALAALGPVDQATLHEMVSDSFDPTKIVLLSKPLATSNQTSPASTNHTAGTVEFKSYSPKHTVLQTSADSASVLLLNDKYDPDWKVIVDGAPAELLRCNFIMRGVHLSPGQHKVEFVFRPNIRPVYVGLVGIILAGALLGYLGVQRRQSPTVANS
jgi:hypothetical protein